MTRFGDWPRKQVFWPSRQHAASFVTIERGDVGKVFEGIGTVQIRDIGKRLYSKHGIVQAENDEQFQARITAAQIRGKIV